MIFIIIITTLTLITIIIPNVALNISKCPMLFRRTLDKQTTNRVLRLLLKLFGI